MKIHIGINAQDDLRPGGNSRAGLLLLERLGMRQTSIADSNFTTFIRQPKRYAWEPKEDITAYELAQAMSVLLAGAHGSKHVEHMLCAQAPEVQRHFREIAPPKSAA